MISIKVPLSALGDILTDTIGGYWESAGRSDIGDTYDSVLSILQLGLLVTSLLLLFVSVLGQINIGLSSLEQRTHELLIRRAIGASRTNIVALVLGSQLILSIFVCLAEGYRFLPDARQEQPEQSREETGGSALLLWACLHDQKVHRLASFNCSIFWKKTTSAFS